MIDIAHEFMDFDTLLVLPIIMYTCYIQFGMSLRGDNV